MRETVPVKSAYAEKHAALALRKWRDTAASRGSLFRQTESVYEAI
jgi:hypothetical protein